MLTTDRYPRNNNDWEDQTEDPKTQYEWNNSYKRAHAKARVKAQAAKGSDKFGAANAAGRILKNSKVATDNGGDEVDMKALKGYFDNLATTSTNEKSVLEQLVANNNKLDSSNKELVRVSFSCEHRHACE